MVDKLETCVVEAASSLGFTLKEKQLEAILSFMSGNCVCFTAYRVWKIFDLCSLPIAFDLFKGKLSDLLHLTLFHFTGKDGSIVICVSPLVSLMMDQKAKFVPMGIVAEFVGVGFECNRKCA